MSVEERLANIEKRLDVIEKHLESLVPPAAEDIKKRLESLLPRLAKDVAMMELTTAPPGPDDDVGAYCQRIAKVANGVAKPRGAPPITVADVEAMLAESSGGDG